MNDKDTKSEDFRGLPPSLAELGMLMQSADAARKLGDKFGGTHISVPLTAAADGVIARACGIEVARALSDVRGGESIYIPYLCPKRRAAKAVLILRRHRDAGVTDMSNCVFNTKMDWPA